MAGTSAIGGLVSGLDTTTIVEQLIAVSRKRIDIVVKNKTKQEDKLTSFQSLNTQLASFQSQAESLKNSDTFNVFKSSASTNSINFSADSLVTASVSTDASPGVHTIEFTSASQLAQAGKLSSKSYSSSSTALGLSGEFIINGTAISVSSTDTLANIVSIINTANTGANATGVTASLLSVSDTDNRLILTSDNTGKNKLSILDASSGDILQSLGLTNGSTTIKNATSDGAKSDKFSSSTTAIGSLLNQSSAQNSTTVGIAGTNVTINLASDSLTDIANTIDAVANVSASVTSTTTDGVTTYQLDISGTTSFTDSNNILETLGILEGSQSSVAEVHTASASNSEISAASGTYITGSTTFNNINTGSDANNVANSDTITLQGTDHSGAAVTGTFTITDKTTDTLDDLLTQIEATFGLGASSATIDATGQIVITDDTAGDSQLSIEIISNNEGGGTLDFGTVPVTTQGYDMQVTAGQDAKIKIDGVAVSRSSNTIDDVISGVTLNIARIESGSTVNLTVSRDTDSIKSSVSNFTNAYNSIIEFINQEFTYNEETKTSGVLAGESTLSTIKNIIRSTLSNTIPLLPSGSNALSLIGITSDKSGKLSMKESTFMSKLNSDFNAVKRMFVAEGTTTNSEIGYLNHTKKTVAGEYAVTINTVATQASVTGSIVLTSGIGGGNTDTLTITDTATNRVATINLDGDPSENGSSIDNIVNAINSELDAERTQTLVGSVANTSSASPITSATTFSAIDSTTLADNDVISFTGTTRSGISINDSYTINNVSTDTVQGLLSAIESAYNNDVSASINSSGKIVLTDNYTGDSSLSITITEPSGKGLDFGTVLTSNTDGINGRYAIEITASKDGSDHLTLTHDTYGSGNGFTTAETNDLLGTEGTYSGVDVAGTINGEAATGLGQILTGNAPPDSSSTTSIEGISLKAISTTTGSKGNVKLTMGIAELMYNKLDTITAQFDGLLTIRMDGLDDSIDDIQKTIFNMEDRLVREQTRLNNQFVQLELSLSKLQSVSSFMTQQLSKLD